MFVYLNLLIKSDQKRHNSSKNNVILILFHCKTFGNAHRSIYTFAIIKKKVICNNDSTICMYVIVHG